MRGPYFLNTYYVLCTSDTVSHVTLSYKATETQQTKGSRPRSHSCSGWSGTQIQDSQTAKSILLQASQVPQVLRRQDIAATGPSGGGGIDGRRGSLGEAQRGREGVGPGPPALKEGRDGGAQAAMIQWLGLGKISGASDSSAQSRSHLPSRDTEALLTAITHSSLFPVPQHITYSHSVP